MIFFTWRNNTVSFSRSLSFCFWWIRKLWNLWCYDTHYCKAPVTFLIASLDCKVALKSNLVRHWYNLWHICNLLSSLFKASSKRFECTHSQLSKTTQTHHNWFLINSSRLLNLKKISVSILVFQIPQTISLKTKYCPWLKSISWQSFVIKWFTIQKAHSKIYSTTVLIFVLVPNALMCLQSC